MQFSDEEQQSADLKLPIYFGVRVNYIILGAGILCASILIWFFLFGPVGVIPVERHRADTIINMRKIYLAITCYRDQHGSFPPSSMPGPDGEMWHSWRVLILPQLGYDSAYRHYRMSEPWNSDHNMRVCRIVPPVYLDPNRFASAKGVSNYLAVVGSTSAWDLLETQQADKIRSDHEVALLVESSDSAIPWHAPGDISSSEIAGWPNRKSSRGPSSRFYVPQVLLLNGEIVPLTSRISQDQLRKLLIASETPDW